MKKAGILTFHNVPNYGAVLQAYALKTYLEKEYGFSVSILDFQCQGNSDEFIPRNYLERLSVSSNPLKKTVKKILIKANIEKSYTEKHNKFENFRKKNLNLSEFKCEDNGCDYIFCGSDQIWNYEITGGFQPPYFGCGLSSSKTKCISYAASCGDIENFSPENIEKMRELLKGFESISVREKNTQKKLCEMNIDSQVVLDPVFLLDKNEYIKKLGKKTSDAQNYVLEYALRPDSRLDNAAKKIASEKNIQLKKVCGYCNLRKEDGFFNAGPEDFIDLVSNAEYIVTNSFHGTAFSLVFRKDFNVCLPQLRKGRIVDLLEILNLKNRICDDENNFCSDSINYEKIETTMEEQIAFSKDFIRKTIEKGN